MAMRVLIAGGGVAGLETALALRALAGKRVEIELLAPETHFWYRPLSVVEPFGDARVHGLELAGLAEEIGAGLTLAGLAAVDPPAHVARTSAGVEIAYDVLVVASGARPVPAVDGAFTFRGPADSEPFARLLAEELAAGAGRRLVFAVPAGLAWPLPLYELALMTASRAGALDLTVVTPEERPLGVFGAAASAEVASRLGRAAVALVTGASPLALAGGLLSVAPGEAIPADRVVALPRLEGVPVKGLPHDGDGFLRTDAFGWVRNVDDVYGAGDVAAFPVKQGGLAAQQADVVAGTIAAAAGVELVPQPFRPVLRGLLLTGGAPLYLRAEVGGGSGDTSVASTEPLWAPPAKIFGRHLGPFLAARAGSVLSA